MSIPISTKLKWISENEGKLVFWCAGCKSLHYVWVKPNGNRPCWTWNQDGEKPTFTPLILLEGFHDPTDDNKNIENGIYEWKPMRYHSFITDGMIRYLSDCNHDLAGQTIPLTQLPEYEES